MNNQFDNKYSNGKNYASHNGGHGFSYAFLGRNKVIDYDELVQLYPEISERDSFKGITVDASYRTDMIDIDLDNSRTIMPVKDNDGNILPHENIFQDGSKTKGKVTSLEGVYIHSPSVKGKNGNKILTLEDLENSSLADDVFFYGRSWIAGNGYALDTFDPFFIRCYSGGKNAIEPTKPLYIVAFLLGSSFFIFPIIRMLQDMYNLPVSFVFIIYACLFLLIFVYNIVWSKIKHKHNLEFTRRMIQFNLDEKAIAVSNMNRHITAKANVNSADLYEYCPICYATRIDTEIICISCGASLVQSFSEK